MVSAQAAHQGGRLVQHTTLNVTSSPPAVGRALEVRHQLVDYTAGETVFLQVQWTAQEDPAVLLMAAVLNTLVVQLLLHHLPHSMVETVTPLLLLVGVMVDKELLVVNSSTRVIAGDTIVK